MNDFWSVYDQDFEIDGPNGRINRSGSDVKMDFYCECGCPGFLECDVAGYECPHCHAKYAVGRIVRLIKLNESQIKEAPFSFRIGENDDINEARREYQDVNLF